MAYPDFPVSPTDGDLWPVVNPQWQYVSTLGVWTRYSQATFTPAAHDHVANKLTQVVTHESADTDTASTALHHTLGTGANQAAAGNDSRFTTALQHVWQMSLSADDLAPLTGYKSGAAASVAGTITSVIIDCLPDGQPASTDVVVDVYTVTRSGTPTKTSILSTQCIITTGGHNRGEGVLTGTITVTAETMLQVRIVQTDSSCRGLSIRILINRS